MAKMERIRSFIAIELSDELKLLIKDLQNQLKAENLAPVRWVNPNNIHLTLKFLGEIDAGVSRQITPVLKDSLQGILPFFLEVGGLGVFPNLKRVQVVWLGLTGELDKLNQLQQSIESSLTQLGFTPESRRFTQHLTLARVGNRASLDQRQDIGQLVARTSFDADYRMNVNCIHVMRSQLTSDGPIYSQIGTITLK